MNRNGTHIVAHSPAHQSVSVDSTTDGGPARHAWSILLVDDDREVVDGMIRHIAWERLDLQVAGLATNGSEAVDIALEQRPDIVVTDVYMPELDGLELIAILRDRLPDTRIVIHSGYDEFENARKAMRFGVQHFMLKPCPIEEVERVLGEIVADIEAQEKRDQVLAYSNERLAEYTEFLRHKVLRDLLISGSNAQGMGDDTLDLLGLERDARYVVVTLLLVRPPYLNGAQEREWHLLRVAAKRITAELGRELSEEAEVDVHIVDLSDTLLVPVIFARGSDVALSQVARRLANRIIARILSYLKMSLTAGIGNPGFGLAALSQSYGEGRTALEAAEYHEMNRLYTYADVESLDRRTPRLYPIDLLGDMHRAIEQKDGGVLWSLWERLDSEILQDGYVNLRSAQTICTNVLSAIVMEYYSGHRLKEEKSTISEWTTEILGKHSKCVLREWMASRMEEWVKLINEEMSGKRSYRLIRSVKEYVRDNYDRDISLSDLSDHVGANATYLSQLFKRVCEESFVSYLNRYRIEKAKEMLKEHEYLIYEVSEMVGYRNPTYFSQVFKSITGKSPSEY